MLKYDLNWPDRYDELSIELAMVRNRGYISGLGNGHTFHYKAACRLLWPELDTHRWSDLAAKEVTRVNHKITSFMGPGSCVSGETQLLDPTTGQSKPIQSIYEDSESPIVMTAFGPERAEVPFLKGYSDLIEVVLESGKRFTSTPGHRCLTECGFRAVSTLQNGQCLLSYEESHLGTTSGPYQILCLEDVRNLLRTAQGFQSDCPAYCRSYDEQPRHLAATFQASRTLPIGFPEYDHGNHCLDDLVHTHSGSHGKWLNRPSKRDVYFRVNRNQISHSLPLFSGNFLRASDLFLLRTLFSSGRIHRKPFSKPSLDFDHNGLDCEMPCSNYRVLADRVKHIRYVGFGPYYDLTVPKAHHYFAQGTIHHNTAKTHEAAKWGLVEYFADPENTCVLVSSTDIRGLKLRIWGEITDLWQKAINRWPDLPGHILDTRIAITTDALEDGEFGDRNVRDMRKAICGIPCIQDKKYVGLAKYHGIKQKRMRLVGDELALMGGSFLKSIANLNNNTDFQAVVCFNPNDTLDPGGQVAEPVDGWQSHMEPTKTEVWDTRFMSGRCINFVGTDSPNFDDPKQPNKYPYLIGPRKITELISAFGKDSFEYYSQGVGVMKIGQLSRRVLTRDLCRKNRALDHPEWKNTERTKIYALDSAYGGDRCVGGWGEFGEDPDGKQILCVHPPRIIHLTADDEPENIIARGVKEDCDREEIPPENMFHDSTGRGRLGTALARIWSPQTNPIEFGGNATDRPVSLDIYITDPFTRERRLKLCSEEYDRFVTELWFSVAYAVEGGQIRGLPTDVMDELCMRMWESKKNKRKSVEPKTGTPDKPGMKERTGRSPDLGDWCSILVEGARQRGFQIARLGNGKFYNEGFNWLTDKVNQHRNLLRSKMLTTR